MIKEIDPTPVFEGMTYDSSCWLAINVSSSEKTEVIFYNPKQMSSDEGFEKLSQFAEYVFDENFISRDDKPLVDINETKCTKSACDVKEDEDYDEETGRSWKIQIPDGQIIDVYKNIPKEKISELIKAANTDLSNMEKDAVSNAKDDNLLRNDPHRYYGVSPSDFR